MLQLTSPTFTVSDSLSLWPKLWSDIHTMPLPWKLTTYMNMNNQACDVGGSLLITKNRAINPPRTSPACQLSAGRWLSDTSPPESEVQLPSPAADHASLWSLSPDEPCPTDNTEPHVTHAQLPHKNQMKTSQLTYCCLTACLSTVTSNHYQNISSCAHYWLPVTTQVHHRIGLK